MLDHGLGGEGSVMGLSKGMEVIFAVANARGRMDAPNGAGHVLGSAF